jgi:hypothetical protein
VIPAASLSRLEVMPMRDAGMLEVSLRDADVDVLRIDGSDIVDRQTIMDRFATDLDLAEGERPSGWDGLADRLRGVLTRLHAPHAVLVWTHVEQLARRSAEDLVMAVVVLSDLTRDVAAPGFPRTLRFSVVLLGDDPAFDRAE